MTGGHLHNSKSSNLTTLKKFDVLHRDKSQPDVLFRNGGSAGVDKNSGGRGGGLAGTNSVTQ